jgi:hypothetical protein
MLRNFLNDVLSSSTMLDYYVTLRAKPKRLWSRSQRSRALVKRVFGLIAPILPTHLDF